MIVSAPGKLVLSGAYAILRGAPALVTAADRRVVVDSTRRATFETPEVAAGLGSLKLDASGHPFFDASALREGDRKLGLGSSAAICAASLFALWYESRADPPAKETWAAEIYPLALRAHRSAQGGGSGIDVAAACFGGTLKAMLDPEIPGAAPQVEACHLPRDLVIEVWASDRAAKTSDFVKRVFARQARHPDSFEQCFGKQFDASKRAASHAVSGRVDLLLEALRDQVSALRSLGELCEVPIVLPEVWSLHQSLGQDACFLPSGAGGGDVSLYWGRRPSPSEFRRAAADRNLERVELDLGAEGLRIDG